MVKVIMGTRGSGKTKQVIEMVNTAVNDEKGNVVCVEKGTNLRYNIKYKAKLINITDYNTVLSYDTLYAFICGIYSGNYDVTHIFIDSLYKITGDDDDSKAEDFLEKLKAFSDEHGVKVTITISDDIESASEGIKKFF